MTITWPTTWRTPEWEADYAATLAVNPDLAAAMLHVHNFSDIAGQIYAGEMAITNPQATSDGPGPTY